MNDVDTDQRRHTITGTEECRHHPPTAATLTSRASLHTV
jgi:hypothetical protein